VLPAAVADAASSLQQRLLRRVWHPLLNLCRRPVKHRGMLCCSLHHGRRHCCLAPHWLLLAAAAGAAFLHSCMWNRSAFGGTQHRGDCDVLIISQAYHGVLLTAPL
jgi:hypothetical protein